MTNFLEQELWYLFGDGRAMDNPYCSGQSCYGTLDKDLRVRIQFISTHISGHAPEKAYTPESLSSAMAAPASSSRHITTIISLRISISPLCLSDAMVQGFLPIFQKI